MNDRRIYFIGERKQQIDTYSTKHIIQLRRLTLGGRCGRLFPVTSTDPFDIDSCSRLIAVVSSETYTSFPRYQPLEGLLAVPAADGSAVDIYLQVSQFREAPIGTLVVLGTCTCTCEQVLVAMGLSVGSKKSIRCACFFKFFLTCTFDFQIDCMYTLCPPKNSTPNSWR